MPMSITRVSAVFAALVLLATVAACQKPFIDNSNVVTVTTPTAIAPAPATPVAEKKQKPKAPKGDRTVIRDQRAAPAVADGKFYEDAKPAK